MRLIPGPAGHVDLSAFNGDNENDGDDCDNNEADASHGLSRRRVDSSMHAVKEVFLSVSYQRSYSATVGCCEVIIQVFCLTVALQGVCVCVCVCVRERESSFVLYTTTV